MKSWPCSHALPETNQIGRGLGSHGWIPQKEAWRSLYGMMIWMELFFFLKNNTIRQGAVMTLFFDFLMDDGWQIWNLAEESYDYRYSLFHKDFSPSHSEKWYRSLRKLGYLAQAAEHWEEISGKDCRALSGDLIPLPQQDTALVAEYGSNTGWLSG